MNSEQCSVEEALAYRLLAALQQSKKEPEQSRIWRDTLKYTVKHVRGPAYRGRTAHRGLRWGLLGRCLIAIDSLSLSEEIEIDSSPPYNNRCKVT